MTSALDVQDSGAQLLLTRGSTDGGPTVTQMVLLAAYGPPETQFGRVPQLQLLMARAGEEGQVTTIVTQAATLIAYGAHAPAQARSASWTFVMDGHRFYVLPLGPEGDWAWDTTTQEWCQLQTQGFDGLNFTHGVMWGLRVMGGDSLYNYLYELDPNQPLDEGFRTVKRMVTGGIATRSRAYIGVGNFTLTASVGDDNTVLNPISLAFSDDNGFSWSQEFNVPLTDQSTQTLIWSSLGGFAAPGRVFRVTDDGGPVRFDGADCVLTVSSGADSSQDQDGEKH